MSRGFTLLEVIVVLLLLGFLAGLSGLAVRSLAPPGAAVIRELAHAREDAIRAGASRVWIRNGVTVRFEPDGSASGGRVTVDGLTVTIDPVTGEIRAAR